MLILNYFMPGTRISDVMSNDFVPGTGKVLKKKTGEPSHDDSPA